MIPDYPLRFKPFFRRYLWGGRRLETVLGKSIPEGTDYAESWEIADHGPDDQSVVEAGQLTGTTLGALVQQFGRSLLGLDYPQSQFPLLFKFLDAQKDLSVQVHPNDEQAARLPRPDRGKTEAWVVLAAEPGSRIFAGLRSEVDREMLEREIEQGTAERCLHSFEPQVGDCILIPAGTVHAIGRGLVVAEIQQSSDTTFRLYDWDRVGADGQRRPLHVQQALDVIDFHAGPAEPALSQETSSRHIERLVSCDKFVLDRWRFSSDRLCGGDGRCHILVLLEGQIRVERDAAEGTFDAGETMLLPAAAGSVSCAPVDSATMLDIYLPEE